MSDNENLIQEEPAVELDASEQQSEEATKPDENDGNVSDNSSEDSVEDEPITEVPSEPYNPFEIKGVRNPHWSTAEKKMIDVEVLFAQFEDNIGWIPFTASPDDVETHGKEIYDNAVAGEYGVVQDAPGMTEAQADSIINGKTRIATQKISNLQDIINTLQDAIDYDMADENTQSDLDAATAEQKAWKKYRIELSRVKNQDTYPASITLPEEPSSTAE